MAIVLVKVTGELGNYPYREKLRSVSMQPTCMQSGTPVLSMRLATLTVFPQISY